ncbi:MAG TPA: ABC transporter ATP-binding protein [Candidatus Saccharimonadales bacterium]|nr:ABC transporter ATP-binding protein [Candidatus Saccharimonadales bacterium]
MNVISVQDVTKDFGSTKALRGINLTVESGQVFGFLGPNGAGKTTMIRAMMDFIRPTSGSIRIFGADSQSASADLKQKIGFLSADNALYPHWTGRTHIDFAARLSGKGQYVDEIVRRLDLNLSAKAGQLSSGNKQKLALALAVVGDPELLIMDEPTRGLDPLLQNELYSTLGEFKAKGGTIFLSSHNLGEVQRICDTVAVINRGKLVAEKSMNDFRDMHVHMVSVVVAKTVDPKQFNLKNVDVVSSQGSSLTLKVRGDINPILSQLSQLDVKDLEVSHLSLEEVFMELYK